MKINTLPLLALLIAGTCFATGSSQIVEADLKLGGIAIGSSETEMIKILGKPITRQDTGEGFKLGYAEFDVYVDAQANRVFDIVSRNPSKCTPSKVCPGMSIRELTRAYGSPVLAVREEGSFLEYVPAGSACWLQASVGHEVISSLRIACQP